MYKSGGTVKRKIQDLIVNPSLDKMRSGAQGTIINYNVQDGVACVRTVVNSNYVTYDGVPVVTGTEGVVSAVPKPGDKVFINYYYNDTPYISAVFSSQSDIRRNIYYGPQVPRITGVI